MKRKKIVSFICCFLLLFSFNIPTSANSRAQVWEGTDANGIVFKEGDVPIQVESELLTFDIPTLPYASYRDVESFLAYDSKVTAEYTFYNPTDLTITATLLFPFGRAPEYSKLYDSETGETFYDEEFAKYGVSVNGAKIDATVRHTDIYSLDKFDINDHIGSLGNEYINDDFYRPDLTVTKYSYEVVGQKPLSIYFRIDIDSVGSERAIMDYGGKVGSYINNSGGVSITASPKENEKQTVCFYVLGEALTETPNAGWYQRNGGRPESQVDGEFRYLGSESTTLENFIFGEYKSDSGVSEIDWYNSCVTRLKRSEEVSGTTRAIQLVSFGSLMRWFEYKITLAPGEKIKNAVVAPMYPEIEAWDQPYEYNYTYLLSPASNWADFGRLDIVINTPYEMSESNLVGFEKTENGYRLSREGLPTSEEGYIDFNFTLLNDGNTQKNQPNPNLFMRILEGIGNFFVSIFALIFVAILYVINFIGSLFKG